MRIVVVWTGFDFHLLFFPCLFSLLPSLSKLLHDRLIAIKKLFVFESNKVLHESSLICFYTMEIPIASLTLDLGKNQF